MLKEKSGILQGVLDAMQDMVRVLDPEHNVVLANKSYAQCFGEQVGKPCYAMYGSKGSCEGCVSWQCMETGKTQQKRKRFQYRTYLVDASPLFDEGKAIGTVEVFRDITDHSTQQKLLKEQNKQLLHDARFAARMQRNLFLSSSNPDSRIKMASRYMPASSLGGDMFGCLRQSDGRMCFYIADVSGHGIAAAMITLYLANILRGMRFASAAQVLDQARDAFVSMVQDDQLYVSMFAAILDPSRGTIRWANAGLNAVPLLIGNKGLERLFSPALPICNWQKNIAYREHMSHMPEGGRLLLYTDGLLDEKSSRLTEENLERQFIRLEGEPLLNKLERQILPGHEDDVCMLLVTRNTVPAMNIP